MSSPARTHCRSYSLSAMPLQKHECPKLVEQPFKRMHSPYSETRGPVVQKGFVAARVRVIQAAYGHTPKPPTCLALRSLKQVTHHKDRQHPSTLSTSKLVAGAEETSGYNPNLEKDDSEKEDPARLFKAGIADELGDTLGDAKDYAPQRCTDANGVLSTKPASSLSLNESNEERKPSDGEWTELKSSITRRSSLGLRVKKSFMSLRASPEQIPASLDESHRPKKYKILRGAKKKAIPVCPTDPSLTIGPLDTGQPFSYPLASPRKIQDTFNLSPSAPAQPDITDPIELRNLSRGPTVSHQEESFYSDRNGASKTPSDKPQESPTFTKILRRSTSVTSLKPPSLISSTPSTTGARTRWSWWKLGGQKPPPTAEAALGSSLDQLFASPLGNMRRGDQIDGLKRLNSVSTWQMAPDTVITGAIAEQEDENDSTGINTTRQGNKTPRNEGGERKARTSSSVSPALATISATTTHPEHPEHPDGSSPLPKLNEIAEPDTASQPGSSPGAVSASSAPGVQTSDALGGSVQWQNRGQRVKRVQVIVNFDMRDIVSEVNARLKEGKKGQG